MLPAFLITFREVIEASLIVATILGILAKLKMYRGIKTVWLGTILATIVSVVFLGLGSLLGLKIQEIYTGKTEELIEGILMLTSAVFITWAVFWLHKYFAQYKVKLLQKVKSTVKTGEQRGLFILAFTAVFREGFEVILFLATIYLSTSPQRVFAGFGFGILAGLIVAILFFTAVLKLPVYRAFQATTLFLVLFAAGLAGRGVHEFIEAGIIPLTHEVELGFLPGSGNVLGDMIKSIFGWSSTMHVLQLVAYAGYVVVMRWYLYGRKLVTAKM